MKGISINLMESLETEGRGYVTDTCIAFFRNKCHKQAFEIYVTDALKAIADNTCRAYGGGTMKQRFADYLHPQKVNDSPVQSASEIIAGIKAKADTIRATIEG